MLNADPTCVSTRAKKRGLPQLGTLGAGNHYAEIQVVDEIFDKFAAGQMGIDRKGQVGQLRKQMEAGAKADVSMAPKDAQAPPDEPLEPVTCICTLKSHISWR